MEKVALVTGGSRGIGKAIAITLAKDGFTIVINYRNSQEKAKEVKGLIEDIGGKCELIQGDVSDFSSTEKMMKNIYEQFGRLDVLVNNAGITKDQLMLRMTEDEFDDVINVNLKGTFNCIKNCSKKMLKQRQGKIINITSVVGVTGNIGQSNYSASKAGVIGLTKSLAKEFASRNIQVNAVAPGFIKSDMTDAIPDKIKEELINKIPLNKLGEPQDIANIVSFLASDKANYITGQVITVDGGMTI